MSITLKICKFCGKKFGKKYTFDRHVILCEILNNKLKSPHAINSEKEEIEMIPSNAQLFHIIQELAYKCAVLEETVSRLKISNGVKRKTPGDVISSLSEPPTNYSCWVKTIIVAEEWIDFILNNTLCKTISTIITNILELDDIPLHLESKNLFIFENSEWSKCSAEMFVLIVQHIHSKLFTGLCKWSSENEEQINKDSLLDDLNTKTLEKLATMNIQQESAKIRAEILSANK